MSLGFERKTLSLGSWCWTQKNWVPKKDLLGLVQWQDPRELGPNTGLIMLGSCVLSPKGGAINLWFEAGPKQIWSGQWPIMVGSWSRTHCPLALKLGRTQANWVLTRYCNPEVIWVRAFATPKQVRWGAFSSSNFLGSRRYAWPKLIIIKKIIIILILIILMNLIIIFNLSVQVLIFFNLKKKYYVFRRW